MFGARVIDKVKVMATDRVRDYLSRAVGLIVRFVCHRAAERRWGRD
jgi:hypothetical protein